jgi:hypothetical protein
VQEKLVEIIEECDISEYQLIDQVKAKSRKADPRMNNPVWPGYNSAVVMQVVENDKLEGIARKVRDYNSNVYNSSELITFCAWPATHYFFE